MDLLIEAGFIYMGNSLADEIPHYWVTDFASRRAILTLPYYYHFDDQFFLMFPLKGTGLKHPDSLVRDWRAEFDAQYKRGRYFHMTIHPQHIGWCNRPELLDDVLAYSGAFPTCGTRPARNARAIGSRPVLRATLCASRRACGRTIRAA